MQTSKDRATQFEKELKLLLKKWNTEIELEEEERRPYMPGTYTMKVYIPEIWIEEKGCVAESAEINLGSYYYAD